MPARSVTHSSNRLRPMRPLLSARRRSRRLTAPFPVEGPTHQAPAVNSIEQIHDQTTPRPTTLWPRAIRQLWQWLGLRLAAELTTEYNTGRGSVLEEDQLSRMAMRAIVRSPPPIPSDHSSLDRQLMDLLPEYRVRNVRKIRSQRACSICQTEYITDDVLRRLPCLHQFHAQCLLPWLSTRTTCPCCRQDVSQGVNTALEFVSPVPASPAVEDEANGTVNVEEATWLRWRESLGMLMKRGVRERRQSQGCALDSALCGLLSSLEGTIERMWSGSARAGA